MVEERRDLKLVYGLKFRLIKDESQSSRKLDTTANSRVVDLAIFLPVLMLQTLSGQILLVTAILPGDKICES